MTTDQRNLSRSRTIFFNSMWRHKTLFTLQYFASILIRFLCFAECYLQLISFLKCFRKHLCCALTVYANYMLYANKSLSYVKIEIERLSCALFSCEGNFLRYEFATLGIATTLQNCEIIVHFTPSPKHSKLSANFHASN